MKYYKSNSFIKAIGSTGFVTITACVLIAVGAIAWFALSRNNSVTETPSASQEQSYNQPNTSYNNDVSESETPDESVADVNEPVSDIPYSEESPIETNQEPSTESVIKFILPIEGNVLKGYSDTALQYSLTYGDMRLHTGIDIECELGSEVKSAGSGTVKSIVDDAGYGKVITIDHTGEITVKYCGFKEVNLKEGDNVNAGDILGTVGEIPCECADKAHIHIEAMLQNASASPLAALGLE